VLRFDRDARFLKRLGRPVRIPVIERFEIGAEVGRSGVECNNGRESRLGRRARRGTGGPAAYGSG